MLRSAQRGVELAAGIRPATAPAPGRQPDGTYIVSGAAKTFVPQTERKKQESAAQKFLANSVTAEDLAGYDKVER